MIGSIARVTAAAAVVAGACVLSRTPVLADGGETPRIVDSGTVEGAIVRTFAHERLLELKVERVCDIGKLDKKDEDKNEKAPVISKTGLRPGQVIFVDVTNAQVLDDKGVEKVRDDKTAWFTKDAGWAVLKDGLRVKVTYASTREIPAPTTFPADARSGGKLLVYVATLVEMCPASPIMVNHASGAVEGAFVHLFSKEKIIELKVEKVVPAEMHDGNSTEGKAADGAATKAVTPRQGDVIFLSVTDASVYDEKGLERKRDDRSAWFSRDDGWSIFKEGHRAKVEFDGTQEIVAPKDFPEGARVGGNVLVYRVTAVHACPDTK